MFAKETQQHNEPSIRSYPSQLSRLLLLSGILCAFALRIFRLGNTSLWYDETVSAFLAQKTIPALLEHTAGDIHPPGYYLFLHLWQKITLHPPAAGFEFLLAWPSLWFGLLVVALTYAIGRRLFTTPIALLALWLAAIQPFQIWYSQEVRMYTLGAALGLVALWSLLQAFYGRDYNGVTTHDRHGQAATLQESAQVTAHHKQQTRQEYQRFQNKHHLSWLICYVLCGALGFYTLYYFLFLLIALNIIALYLLFWPTADRQMNRHERARGTTTLLRNWLLAQLGILLLWLPWLPIFWHQVTDPPVPPWRVPWETVSDIGTALSESMSALLSGQSTPAPTHWLWLGLAFVLLGSALMRLPKVRNNASSFQQGLTIVALYLLVPLLLLYGITLVGTPLYHVRYLMLYAPPLTIWVAVGLYALDQRWHGMGVATCVLLVVLNGVSLFHFWTDPQFERDDHRAAVAELAKAWRPGDVILVNAGWVYTAVELYWPTQLIGADAALPPNLAQVTRIHDYAQKIGGGANAVTDPLLVRTGSVDGPTTLGWGNPESDFFGLDRETTVAAMETIGQHHRRIWHYRLYDTVNDPQGLIRQWLTDHGDLVIDQPIPGRDYLRLQLYELSNYAYQERTAPPNETEDQPDGPQLLSAQPMTTTVTAGTTLYLQANWHFAGKDSSPAHTSLSLRLYDTAGHQVAQQDSSPWSQSAVTTDAGAITTALALPIPIATQPGSYLLRLLLYDQRTGIPIPATDSVDGDPFYTVNTITITPAKGTPVVGSALVHFDYLQLVAHHLGQTSLVAGDAVPITLVWMPRESEYRDTYLLRWSLVAQGDDRGGSEEQIVQQWEEPLGSWEYPSALWPPDIPVRQQSELPIRPELIDGTYQLRLQLLRGSDQKIITPQVPWWRRLTWQSPLTIEQEMVVVGAIRISH